MPHSLYTPLLVSKEPLIVIFMNFILELPRSKKNRDSIFVVVYRLSKIMHFISCYKIDDATNITDLFLRK